jgi:hypothetical protein
MQIIVLLIAVPFSYLMLISWSKIILIIVRMFTYIISRDNLQLHKDVLAVIKLKQLSPRLA